LFLNRSVFGGALTFSTEINLRGRRSYGRLRLRFQPGIGQGFSGEYWRNTHSAGFERHPTTVIALGYNDANLAVIK
jgi:hypothetical protein